MHIFSATMGTPRAIPAPLGLARQSFDVGFDCSNPELHGVALVRHAVKSTRPDQHRLPVNLDRAAEKTGFVLGDREHNAVAADAAAEGATSDAIGHSGSSITGRVHCTPAHQQCIVPSAGPDHPTTGILLSGTVFGLGPLSQRPGGYSLGLFKSRAARSEGPRLHLDRRAMVDVHREQTPLPGVSTPDVGRVRVPGAGYRQRDTMKRLWSLLCCHFHRRVYSRFESAPCCRGPQAKRTESLSAKGSEMSWTGICGVHV